jgi:hypothetical protein
VDDDDAAGVGDAADDDGVQIPLAEDVYHLPLAAAVRDDEHPLLRLGEHDLVGGHPLLALRDEREV